MISTVTNRGRPAFMVFKERFTSVVMIQFLKRLVKHSRQKVYLIVDRHPVHRARKVQQWLECRRKAIRMFLLPEYSPELNPDELLNQDVKTNAVGRQRPTNQSQMMCQVRSYLRSTQRQPQIVRNYLLKLTDSTPPVVFRGGE
jgi:transposase